jgi:hypothetical protein
MKTKSNGTHLYMHTIMGGIIFRLKKTKPNEYGDKRSFLVIEAFSNGQQLNQMKIGFDSDTLKRLGNWMINESENISDCETGGWGIGFEIHDNNSNKHVDEYINKDNYDKINSIISDINIKNKQYEIKRLEKGIENEIERLKREIEKSNKKSNDDEIEIEEMEIEEEGGEEEAEQLTSEDISYDYRTKVVRYPNENFNRYMPERSMKPDKNTNGIFWTPIGFIPWYKTQKEAENAIEENIVEEKTKIKCRTIEIINYSSHE